MNSPVFSGFLDVENGHFMLLVELQHPFDEFVKNQFGCFAIQHRRRE